MGFELANRACSISRQATADRFSTQRIDTYITQVSTSASSHIRNVGVHSFYIAPPLLLPLSLQGWFARGMGKTLAPRIVLPCPTI